LQKDLREFIECLNRNEVEYLLVGAIAVAWHGFPRYSGDTGYPPKRIDIVTSISAMPFDEASESRVRALLEGAALREDWHAGRKPGGRPEGLPHKSR
jgi:hypothetical protein